MPSFAVIDFDMNGWTPATPAQNPWVSIKILGRASKGAIWLSVFLILLFSL